MIISRAQSNTIIQRDAEEIARLNVSYISEISAAAACKTRSFFRVCETRSTRSTPDESGPRGVRHAATGIARVRGLHLM